MLISPTRKPIETEALIVSFTPLRDTVNRWLSAMPVRVTITSVLVVGLTAALAVPIANDAESIAAAIPACVTGPENRNTIW